MAHSCTPNGTCALALTSCRLSYLGCLDLSTSAMCDDFGESAGFIKDEFNLDGFGASFSSVTDELSLTGVDTGLERKAQVSNPPLGFTSLNGDEDIFMLDDPHGLMVDPIDPNDPSAPGLPPCGSGLALVPGSRSSLFSAQSTVMEMEMDGETKAGTAAVDWLLCTGVSGSLLDDVSGGNGMILLLHLVTPFKPFSVRRCSFLGHPCG